MWFGKFNVYIFLNENSSSLFTLKISIIKDVLDLTITTRDLQVHSEVSLQLWQAINYKKFELRNKITPVCCIGGR